MIHIEVDYQGDRSIETYSFMSTGDDYQAKLDEIENHSGKIDRLAHLGVVPNFSC